MPNDFLRAFGHREVSIIATRLFDLAADKSDYLRPEEINRARGAAARIETLATHFWRFLDALNGKPLLDPGCRPLAQHFWPGAFRQTPDFDAALGYFHRCREFADRLDAAVATRKAAGRK